MGRPKPNSAKFFGAVEVVALPADRDWLDEATKSINLHWRRKGLRAAEEDAGVIVG